MTQSMKTPYIGVIGYRENKLVLTWKFHSCWIAFIVPEAAIHVIEGKKQLKTLLSFEAWDSQQLTWQDMTTGAIVARGYRSNQLLSDCI